jgi:hypothetical protein
MDLYKVLTGIPRWFEKLLPQAAEAARKARPLEKIRQALSSETPHDPQGVPSAEEARARQEAAAILAESRPTPTLKD